MVDKNIYIAIEIDLRTLIRGNSVVTLLKTTVIEFCSVNPNLSVFIDLKICPPPSVKLKTVNL